MERHGDGGLIAGDPGIGKSTLILQALGEYARRGGHAVKNVLRPRITESVPTGPSPVNAGEVMRLLHEACQRGVAAVVVTHDAQLAAWADRVVFLRDGRVTGQTARPPGPESLLMPRQTR